MKCIFMTLLLLVLSLIAFVLSYRWDEGTNHGLSFGYYREFNAVSNALVSLRDVTILDSGANRDVTLEEFGFTLQTDTGRPFRFWFRQDDPIRKLTGDKLTEALKSRILKEASNNTHEGIAEELGKPSE